MQKSVKFITLSLISFILASCGGTSDSFTNPSISSEDLTASSENTSITSNEDTTSEISSSEESTSESETSITSEEMSSEDISSEGSSTSEDTTLVVKESISYHIEYTMSGKTSYRFKDNESELIKDTFVLDDNEDESIINSVESFNYIYGGGYGGSGESSWTKGNMLKFGTTSVNGDLALELSRPVNKIKVTGLVGNKSLKIQAGDKDSSDWLGEEDDNKTQTITCSDFNVASKSTIDEENYSSAYIEFEATSYIKIAAINSKVFYLTNIEFYFSEDVPTKTYTVTWKHSNGTILEVDNDVLEGTIPTYDSETPYLECYTFKGWTPVVSKIYKDTIFTTIFVKDGDVKAGYDPTISIDGKTIEYGFYPQSYVSDEYIVNELEKIYSDTLDTWCLFNNDYYVKVTSNIYNNEAYKFSNNEDIINSKTYWFKCDTIKWEILNASANEYLLISSVLLDSHSYYSSFDERNINNVTIYPNNYEESDIRNWLNNDFLNTAFSFGSDHIKTTLVDNSVSSLDTPSNIYFSNDTKDKVFLPSFKDMNNPDYGFTSNTSRQAKTTDYLKAIGGYSNNKDSSYLNNGSYWTRSPSSNFSYASFNVNSGGVLSEYAVDGNSHSVRPCITITL